VSSDGGENSVLRVLFICTGNTCRSPMAEVLFRKLLADRLVCRDWELRERRIDVFSAGIAAEGHNPASREAVLVMQEQGLDLSQHLSQQVTDHMLENSTLILALTDRHRRILLDARPDLKDRIYLLRMDGEDINDPIGGPIEDYRNCAEQIRNHLNAWVDELIRKDSKP